MTTARAPERAHINTADDHGQVLAAVRRRLAAEPDVVYPALALIADPEAVIAEDDEDTVALARALNTHRVVAGLREFRAHAHSTEQVRERLGGVSRQAVSQRVRNERLMSMEISGRSWFPDWQFTDTGLVDGLTDIIVALRETGRDAYTADAVMRTRLPEEGGRTPADLLAAGEIDRTLHYVHAVGGGY